MRNCLLELVGLRLSDCYFSPQTPLYLAAKRGKVEACEVLIEHGASLLHKCFGKTVSIK